MVSVSSNVIYARVSTMMRNMKNVPKMGPKPRSNLLVLGCPCQDLSFLSALQKCYRHYLLRKKGDEDDYETNYIISREALSNSGSLASAVRGQHDYAPVSTLFTIDFDSQSSIIGIISFIMYVCVSEPDS